MFQSTLPARGSDKCWCGSSVLGGGFNPRSPRGGATTPWGLRPLIPSQFQSTLPARGSDLGDGDDQLHNGCRFNPRSPRGGATATSGVTQRRTPTPGGRRLHRATNFVASQRYSVVKVPFLPANLSGFFCSLGVRTLLKPSVALPGLPSAWPRCAPPSRASCSPGSRSADYPFPAR